MNDSTRKILVFILVGVGAFMLAFGLGRVAGDKEEPASGHEGHEGHADRASYRVELADDELAAGDVDLELSVLDADGGPVTAYDVRHEKELHLIVVERDDPRIYAHLHPELTDGVWTVRTSLDAGDYRLYADTQPKGADAQVLVTDLVVAGDHPDREAPTSTNDTASVDGYDVALATQGEAWTFTVTKDGEPVTLERYLGAGGHLVGIRTESLDYLHAHAEDADGNTVGFHVEAESSGTYVLHLDFQVDGKVHSATFVQRLEHEGPGGGMGDHEGHDMSDTEPEGHDGH